MHVINLLALKLGAYSRRLCSSFVSILDIFLCCHIAIMEKECLETRDCRGVCPLWVWSLLHASFVSAPPSVWRFHIMSIFALHGRYREVVCGGGGI